MGVSLKYIGQAAMDNYFRDYKPNTGFFELNDFIFRAAATISSFYQKIYDVNYQELRQDKINKTELVSFDPDILSVQEMEIKDNEAKLKFPVMSFLSDKSSTGYQFLLPIKPKEVTFERSSMDDLWVYQYVPKTSRVFWRPQGGKIKFFKNFNGGLITAELYYIPSVMNSEGEIFGDAIIPDGLMEMAINGTIAAMRQVLPQTVKETNDLNQNSIMQSEINKEAVK